MPLNIVALLTCFLVFSQRFLCVTSTLAKTAIFFTENALYGSVQLMLYSRYIVLFIKGRIA